MVGIAGPRFGRMQIAPICTTPAISRSPPTGVQIERYARDLVGASLTASNRTVLSGHLVARGERR